MLQRLLLVACSNMQQQQHHTAVPVLLSLAQQSQQMPELLLSRQQHNANIRSSPLLPAGCSCSYASTSTSAPSAEAATSTSSSSSSSKRSTYPTRHEQRVAHFQFCRERAAWRRQVKELRKQWLAEAREKQAAHRAAAESVRQQIAELQKLRNVDKQHDKEAHMLDNALRSAERDVENAERRLAAARREEWRQATLQHFRKKWHQKLVGKSRSWIAPEDLEARIEAALEYPRKL